MMLALLSLVTLASCSKDDPFPATPEESAQGQVSLKKMLVDITNEEVVYEDGCILVPDKPGLGFDELNEELIAEKLHADFPVAWESTEQWDKEWANDRQWS